MLFAVHHQYEDDSGSLIDTWITISAKDETMARETMKANLPEARITHVRPMRPPQKPAQF